MDVKTELTRLSELVDALKGCQTDEGRICVLDREPFVKEWIEDSKGLHNYSLSDELILKSIIAIGQNHLITLGMTCPDVDAILSDLIPVEAFYKEMGGVVGYHWTMLSSLSPDPASLRLKPDVFYHRPPGIDITVQNANVTTYILQGIVSLPQLAEVYPVGGAADRLKFCDPISGEPLPAAKLEFGGFTLLERLIRDVQAREYLYFKLFDEQITTPLVMMTSSEKDNHRHILELCKKSEWFGRPQESFQIFCQPVVPTMDRTGKWCLTLGMKLLMKPGGHGVIWKVADQHGVFDWLEKLGRKKMLVRQINNPIAGIDYGLLAFSGVGFYEEKIFGFASCERQVESAEGINILVQNKEEGQSHYCLTNIEYCDFPKFSIKDIPVEPGSIYSQYPSNTNILFADIGAVKQSIVSCPIPGMLINLKEISSFDLEGNVTLQEVARLESTMQNIADCFGQMEKQLPSETQLKTYLTYNHRQKTISATKKMFQGGGSLLETPEGCFYDLLCNAHVLLSQYCQVLIPEMPPIQTYAETGPAFLFSYHPALGPLFSIIAEKIRGGSFAPHSELKLEIAEVDVKNLKLAGSLHIKAERIVGQKEEVLTYSDQVGSVTMHNVTVENLGYDARAENIYWKDQIQREELCEIVIWGNGEFFAENVTIQGAHRIEVEDGMRVTAVEEGGKLAFKKESLPKENKKWIYHINDDGSIFCERP